MKNIKKAIALLAVGLVVSAVPVQADQRTITHFGREYTLEQYMTVGPGSNHHNPERAIQNFENAWERQQRTGNSGGSSANTNATPVTVTPEQPAVVTPSVPVQPVAPTAPATQDDRYAPFLYTQSQITLPNRRLTEQERQAWIDEYNEMGGASEFELEVLRLVNEERTSRGLNPVTWDNGLAMASRNYAQQMANLNTTLGHREGPYGGSRETGRTFGVVNNFANGAAGRWTPEALVQAWMNSTGHRNNILARNARYAGFGSQLGGQWGVFHYSMFDSNPSNPNN